MVWKQKKEVPNIFSGFFTLIFPLQLDSCLRSHESSPPQLLCATKMSACAHCECDAASEPYFKSWICDGLYVFGCIQFSGHHSNNCLLPRFSWIMVCHDVELASRVGATASVGNTFGRSKSPLDSGSGQPLHARRLPLQSIQRSAPFLLQLARFLQIQSSSTILSLCFSTA